MTLKKITKEMTFSFHKIRLNCGSDLAKTSSKTRSRFDILIFQILFLFDYICFYLIIFEYILLYLIIFFWLYLIIFFYYIWIYLIIFYCIWWYLMIHIWLYLILFDYIWFYWIIFDYIIIWLQEGDDVYFDCEIEANPRVHEIVWKHNVRKIPVLILIWIEILKSTSTHI